METKTVSIKIMPAKESEKGKKRNYFPSHNYCINAISNYGLHLIAAQFNLMPSRRIK